MNEEKKSWPISGKKQKKNTKLSLKWRIHYKMPKARKSQMKTDEGSLKKGSKITKRMKMTKKVKESESR